MFICNRRKGEHQEHERFSPSARVTPHHLSLLNIIWHHPLSLSTTQNSWPLRICASKRQWDTVPITWPAAGTTQKGGMTGTFVPSWWWWKMMQPLWEADKEDTWNYFHSFLFGETLFGGLSMIYFGGSPVDCWEHVFCIFWKEHLVRKSIWPVV